LTFYLDTSVLVSALTREARTSAIQSWLAQDREDELVISDWVLTEFSAALSMKVRTGHLSAADRTQTLAMFRRLSVESLDVWPVDAIQFRAAAHFADQYALGLRAGDALHLAVCADRGARLCTLDRRLAEAGQALGVATIML